MLLAVLAVAVALGGVRWWGVRSRAMQRAVVHAAREKTWQSMRDSMLRSAQLADQDQDFDRLLFGASPPQHYRSVADAYAGQAAYHAAMRRKHEWAAWHPWAAVAPDPPPPRLGQTWPP
jgi:hypothetical protein